MINLNMAISTEHQSIIPSEFVRINDASPSNGSDGEVDQCGGSDIVNKRYFNYPIAL